MAIHDKPQVDPAATNSARSERRLGDWLNEDYHFILRKEVPDKGCDYVCELMEDSGATNLKFPIQLKSVQVPELVANGTYISYPILTSRLGYMLNFLPTTGIIVLYDVSSEKLYYDFSNKIFDRINNDRSSEEWTRQEYVNVRIPVDNLFTPESVKVLHTSMKSMFENAARMQVANGDKYTLPVFEIPGSTSFDVNNKEHLKNALKQFGLALLMRFDLAPVFNSLSQLTQQEIENDKDLLILACMAYGETGHLYQSELFIKKLKRNFTLDEAEALMIDHTEGRILMQLGRMTATEFKQRLKESKTQTGDVQNDVIIRISLQRLAIMEIKDLKPTPPEITREMNDIFEFITNSGLEDEKKDILSLWNAEQESHLLTHQLHLDLLSYCLSQTLGSKLPREKGMQTILRFMNSESAFIKRVETIHGRAFDKQDTYIQATVLSLLARHFISKLFSFISLRVPMPEPGEQHQQFFNYAMQGYELFVEIAHLKEAHVSLSNALEILYSAKYFKHAGVDKNIKALSAERDRLEKHLMLEPYPLQIPILVENVQKREETEHDNSFADLSDHQIHQLARVLFVPFKLPEERFIHLLNELRAVQLFQQRCKNPDVEFRCYSGRNTGDRYRHPVSFILINKANGIESTPSTNMDALLTSWGVLNDY